MFYKKNAIDQKSIVLITGSHLQSVFNEFGIRKQ